MNFYAKYLANKRYWPTPKLLLVMKLTVLWMFLALAQVSASSFAQQINLNEKNMPLAKVLTTIEKQSGYVFLYDDKEVGKIKISVQIQAASIQQALDASLKNQALTYKIVDKTVMIKKKEPSVIDKIIEFFSAMDVKGKVVDENNQPLQGATIKVKGSTLGTTTDKDGEFLLKGVSEDAIIAIAFLGYKPLELKASESMGVIKMELATSKLEEVKINGGYYETTDRLKTGSIVKVTAKDIEKQPVTSPLMALQGRVPGLEIEPGSGAPGVAPRILIRGANSLRQGKSVSPSEWGTYPLYVIDGVPISAVPLNSNNSNSYSAGFDPLSTLNPSNIESIEVLKDGDATAIYGSRGANGVILITTKKSTNTTERTNLNATFYSGFGQIAKRIKLLNSSEYLSMRREALANDKFFAGERQDDRDLLLWDTTRYTDWQKIFLSGNSAVNDFQSTISSGTKNTSFALNTNYHKETIYVSQDFGYQRFSGQLSVNHHSPNGKFILSGSSILGVDKGHYFNDPSILISAALTLPPVAPELYNDDGSLNWEQHNVQGFTNYPTWDNPMANFKKTQNVTTRNNITNINAGYNITKNLSFSSSAGYTQIFNQEEITSPKSSFPPTGNVPNNMANVENQRISWIVEPKINYSIAVRKHKLNAILGATWQENSSSEYRVVGRSFASDALLGSIKAAGVITISQDETNSYRYNSAYLRLGYSWSERYLLNITGRRDGSSRFGPDNRFGNFGSIGAGWIFSEESIVQKHLPFLSMGKLRASYGITGSDNIGDYNYYNLYDLTSGRYGGITGVVPLALYNPDYKWEVTKKAEVALEMSFVQNRLSFEVDWYRNRSSNQLVGYPLSRVTGFASVLRNSTATIQNAGFEAIIKGEILSNSSWRWTSSVNFSLPTNKLVKFDNIEQSPYATIYKVGEPLSIQYLYTYAGINQQTGLYQFVDRNNNGIIDLSDKSLIDLKGRIFYGGLNNTIQFKTLELSFIIQFSNRKQNRYLPGLPGRSPVNQSIEVLNRWRNPGDITDIQRFDTDDTQIYTNLKSSTFNVTDASFARIKTLSLTYSLPVAFVEKIKLREAKIYVQGQNLLTFTKYEGLDPETGYGLPPLRMMTAGIQFKF